MITAIVYARVSEGKIIPENNYDWDRMLKGFTGKRVTIKMSIPQKIRSNPQSRYLFGVVYKMISDATGYTKDEVHEFFSRKFLTVPIEKNGFITETVRSTTKLTTVEFIEYYRKIIDFVAMEDSLGFMIPEPNEEEMWALMQMVEEEEKRGLVKRS